MKNVRRRSTYFIGSFTKTGRLRAIKIGLCTLGKASRRLKQLQTGTRETLKLLAVIEGASHERKWHRAFSGYKLKGEWFKPAVPLLQMIEDLKQVQSLVAQVQAKEASVPQSVVEAA